MYDNTVAMEYNLTKPIDIIFNAIYNLTDIIELAESQYFPTQVVDLAYMIVSAQSVVRSYIRC